MKTKHKKTGTSGKINSSIFLNQKTNKQSGTLMITLYTDYNTKRSDQLSILANSIAPHGKWIRTLAFHDGLLTHELDAFGLKANNPHQVPQHLNPILVKHGYWVAVYPVTVPQKSWCWKLVTVDQALKLPLHKRTKDRLEALILENLPKEAANDE